MCRVHLFFAPAPVSPDGARLKYLLNHFLNHSTISLGKYRISSLSKALDNGRYGAAVSIRSGRGSASTDRVLRFVPHFDSADDAHLYAHAQGRAWVHQAGLAVGGSPKQDHRQDRQDRQDSAA